MNPKFEIGDRPWVPNFFTRGEVVGYSNSASAYEVRLPTQTTCYLPERDLIMDEEARAYRLDRKGQSKRHSVIESLTNVLIGYVVALVSQLLIFGAYGVHLSIWQNVQIGLWFTVVSVVRSYCLRRFFNQLHVRAYVRKGCGEAHA